MTAPALQVSDLTVRYGEVLALDSVSLALDPARICGLVGTNGSGKTTLFKAILGLVAAEDGQVRMHGHRPRAARAKGVVSYVPQTEQVDWQFPVRVIDVVLMGRYGRMGPTRRPRRADHDAVAAALERTGLTHLAHRQIGALSGGQRKRVFIARAIAQDASLLLLDEPFSGVDRRAQADIVDVLHAMRHEGHTLLVSTHDLAGLARLCDEAVLLQRRVVAHGPPEQVLTPHRLAEAFGVPAHTVGEGAQ
ncbi:manganese transport system ATP-binding protein [Lipingzhangella halophila]|uniref:Manganese transport system ATP-binding protein n=1 Tax=Lipingzhangella halophila TaxID=1783352 RepID=A0A7W7RI81_9ACTN|nr:metal ABC transporter ATP-binding protein [Lipingzhangella halophila]MBB4931931.1 manganese transport system ATP-binding protein [Lipingzhangella halophila]